MALLGALLFGGAVVSFLQHRPGHAADASLLQVRPGSGPQAGSSGGPSVAAGDIDRRLTAATAATGGELEVSLAWNALSDLDLEVRDPYGEVITAHHYCSASGGTMDVDANPTLVTEEGSRRAAQGQNPGPENVTPLPEILVDIDKKLGLPEGWDQALASLEPERKARSRFTRTPVEHIYFARAPRGAYSVYAHCYSWREVNANPLPFTVQVRCRGQVAYETSGTLGPESYITHNTVPTQVCQFNMP